MNRPLEWIKFDPVIVGAEVEGMTFEEQGAYFVLLRQLWTLGPLPEDKVRRYVRTHFEAIRERMFECGDDLLSFEWLEEARAYGQRNRERTSKAGKASASARSNTEANAEQMLSKCSTDVEQVLSTCPTDVLSMSVSSSSSVSNSGEKERAHEVSIWPTFDDWWTLYSKKVDRAKCEAKWIRLDQPTREAIMHHTAAYVTTGKGSVETYRRNPSTYLNNENWNDEALTAPRNDDRRPADQDPGDKYARLMRLAEGGDTGPVF